MSAHDKLTPLEIAIGDWIEEMLPDAYSVVADGQRGPRLDYPFCAFAVGEEQAVGMSAWTVTNTPSGAGVEARETQTQRLRVNVNLFGPTAFADARELRRACERPPAQDRATVLGFGVMWASGVRRLSYVEDTRRVGQANLTLMVSAVHKAVLETVVASEVAGTGEEDLDGAEVPNPW
jgi:hypothetical protein